MPSPKKRIAKITTNPNKLQLAYKASLFQIVAGAFLVIVTVIPGHKDYTATALGVLIAVVGIVVATRSRRQ